MRCVAVALLCMTLVALALGDEGSVIPKSVKCYGALVKRMAAASKSAAATKKPKEETEAALKIAIHYLGTGILEELKTSTNPK